MADTPLESAPQTTRRVNDWQNYKRLLTYVRPYAFIFILAVLGFFLASGAEAYLSRLLGDLVDNWGKANLETASRIALLMFAMALLRAFGNIVGELLLSTVSMNVVHNLRVQLFDHLLEMPSRYFDASSQGHLVSRLTYTVTQLRDTGTDALKTIVQDGGKVLVYFGFMLYLSWKLTVIFIAAAPLLGVVVMFSSRRFRRLSRRIQTSMGDVTHISGEAVGGYRVVKIYGGERYEQQRFHEASQNNRNQNVKMLVTKVFSTEVNEVLVAAAISALIMVLFMTGVGSEMTAGNVITFLGLASLMARPIRKLSEVNAKLQRGLAAAEDIFDHLDTPRETDTGESFAGRVEGRLEFRDVCFAYDRSRTNVLDHINLRIEPGQTVALVGKSGSGKSTIASLIPRFYDVDSGEIMLDGKPLNSYSLRGLRDQIALVTQQVTLFNDTLERNVAYGALAGANRQTVWEALARAHADEFIHNLPNGIETLVGDDGVLLSGGQRQRVAIARALLKDAPILILDEATSALDTESERHIQAALAEVMRGRTTLVIAHRLSTIESADLIVVMQEGRIVEVGDHRTLLARNGVYSALHSAQFEDRAPMAPRLPAAFASQVPDPNPVMTAAHRSGSWIEQAWYDEAAWLTLLRPFAWIFGGIAQRRRARWTRPGVVRAHLAAPVIVVGNISVGGTGKTPLVIALVEWLKTQGFSPGVITRGYGGNLSGDVMQVPLDAHPVRFGDEAPLLARRTQVPVFAGVDRVAAAQALMAAHACDVIVADDGLQHYPLSRDVEIAVVDGLRGLGNGQLLPAGPLREPPSRLAEVDFVVCSAQKFGDFEHVMTVRPIDLQPMFPGGAVSAEAYPPGTAVHAVTGIGNPVRFAQSLGVLGLEAELHVFPDHHVFDGSEVRFGDGRPVIVTEKDAIKLRSLGLDMPQVHVLSIAADVGAGFFSALAARLRELGIHPVQRTRPEGQQ
ncbi:MAG: lipid A export permease/ATP-binding protein MsbA [Gammaproteobacteria bacterium]|nr:lipid A export permease/ATP-binding protein MsbA [Gammaproteobacteria bacterium]